MEEARAAIVEHLDDHYAFYGEAGGVRIARKHLGWYTKDLAGGDAFPACGQRGGDRARGSSRRSTGFSIPSPNAASVSTIARRDADVVDARASFGRSRQESQRGGEALAA